MLHEATGEGIGHSSSAQAGEIARRCGAKELALVHLPVMDADLASWKQDAQDAFGGRVFIAEDFDVYEL